MGWNLFYVDSSLHKFMPRSLWGFWDLVCSLRHILMSKNRTIDAKKSKSKMADMTFCWWAQFKLLQIYCMWSHQTCLKCSSSGAEKVLLLFGAIQNLRCLLGLSFTENIYDFCRSTTCQATRLSRNVPRGILVMLL